MEKHFLFMDECGDPSLKSINHNFPIFVLLGVLISEKEYVELNNKLDKLKMDVFGTTQAILHSRDIRKCEGVFAKLFDLKTKEYFYKQLDSILGTTNYKLIASAIRKEEHLALYGKLADDPYEIGLTFLLERALFELDDTNSTAQVIIEARGQKEDMNLAAKYNQLITRGSQRVQPERFGLRFGTKASFRRKALNDNGLQVADLCAYPTARHILEPNIPQPAFDIISDKFRKSNHGLVDGYGIKIFPTKQ